MPPAQRSQAEEDDFMNNLLSGLENPITPDTPPLRARQQDRRQSPRKGTPKKVGRSPAKHTCDKDGVLPADQYDFSELLEGAEDWDWDVELSPQKPRPEAKFNPPPKAFYNPDPCVRCTVESVTEFTENARLKKKLLVNIEKGEGRRQVILQDDWVVTVINPGDIVNIIGHFSLLKESSSSTALSITISSKENLLILSPDMLLTATSLSNAPQCRRKPLISSLVRMSGSDITPATVWGNMLHTVLQSCLIEQRWDQKWIDERIDETVRDGLSDLFRLDVSVEHAKHQLSERAKGLRAFSDKYISASPKKEAVLSNTRATRNETSALLAITKLLDVEEDIWSPRYGIKGKMDAAVETTVIEPDPTKLGGIITRTGPKPFEIKTGRAIAGMEHRAQTMLYNLLASERYGLDVTSGLLYYTQSEEVVQVPSSRNEIRGLIIARNEMVVYMSKRISRLPAGEENTIENSAFLPPTIDDERSCKRCYALDVCMLYRRAVENIQDNTSPIADAYQMKTGHLTQNQCDFFKSWEHLLSLEEQDLNRFRKELWTLGAREREKKGRCFADMVLDESYKHDSHLPASRETRIHQHTYRFVKATGASGSLLNGFISVGDAITVSVEPRLLALAHGFVLELLPSEVIIGVDHAVSLVNIRERLANFPETSPFQHEVVFRLDRDELFGGMGRMRGNLAQLFVADGDTRRLNLVVDLRRPIFDESMPLLPVDVARHSENLNDNQRQAMGLMLKAQDYGLILGMPGTGKTTIITALIKTLVGLGKTVLLTSYTHSAVDNILLKLKEEKDFDILRLGNADKVHADVQQFTLHSRKRAVSVEQLEYQLMNAPVVATTCLSVDHPLFSRRRFDYCIVDEASQITLPTCLGPLRFADKFILVGDHFQLPPLVKNASARKGGLDVSLFRRLSDAHPHAVVDLSQQYRMNEDIMLLSNKLIYGDRLRCGSTEVANQSLQLPNRSFMDNLHPDGAPCSTQSCWLETLMAEKSKAVFVDTDRVPARDCRVGDLVQNEVEARLVVQTTETLLRSGVAPEQIGIISMYRQQIKLITQLLHQQNRTDIEVLTADKSQGRDKECILISMVRSNEECTVGDLVKDWRRMNVSFTRARSKLVIFGSRSTLKSTALLSEFFKLMESRNWILDLPAKADTIHGDVLSTGTPSKKRTAEVLKEHGSSKKARISALNEEILAKGRPLLKDLMNEARAIRAYFLVFSTVLFSTGIIYLWRRQQQRGNYVLYLSPILTLILVLLGDFVYAVHLTF